MGKSIYLFMLLLLVVSCSALPKDATIVSVSATSTLHQKGDVFNPKSLTDGNLDTYWVEGAPGSGVGQSFTIQFDRPVTLKQFYLLNGLNHRKYYYLNHRIKSLTVNGEKAAVKDIRLFQEVVLPKAVTSDTFTFTIDRVYQTFRDDDAAITEIVFDSDSPLLQGQEKKVSEESAFSTAVLVKTGWMNNTTLMQINFKADGTFAYEQADPVGPTDKFTGSWNRIGDYVLLKFKEKDETKTYILTDDDMIWKRSVQFDFLSNYGAEPPLKLCNTELSQ